MNARWSDAASRCALRALPGGTISNGSRMFSASINVAPEPGGGIVTNVWPWYVARNGSRHSGL